MVFSYGPKISSDTPCSGDIVKPNATNLPSKDDRGQEDTWVQSQGVRMILCHSKVKLTIRSAISYRRYAEPKETLHRLDGCAVSVTAYAARDIVRYSRCLSRKKRIYTVPYRFTTDYVK